MTAFAPDKEQILQLLTAAIRAPSADNRHHVRFGITASGVDLYTDDDFVAQVAPHRRLLTLLSFGAVVENMRLALTQHGWSFVPRWFPDPQRARLLLCIDWSELVPVDKADPLAAQIAGRHTNRRFYGRARSPASELGLLDAAARIDDVHLTWFDDPARRTKLLRLIRAAESERFHSRVLHAEMFDSIDFGAGWKAATTEALAPATLEVEPFLRAPFAAMRHWSFMRAANAVGAYRMLGLRAGDIPARTSPHLGVITSTLEPGRAALAVGAAFERTWLAAESAGLALQPMVASAILATQTDASQGASDATRIALQRGWKELVGDALPLVVFRLGRAKRPRVVSGRRPVESYLLSEDPGTIRA